MNGDLRIMLGQCYPPGSTRYRDGVNLSVFSKNSTALERLSFDRIDDAKPTTSISLEPSLNRTCRYWQVLLLARIPDETDASGVGPMKNPPEQS